MPLYVDTSPSVDLGRVWSVCSCIHWVSHGKWYEGDKTTVLWRFLLILSCEVSTVCRPAE